MMKKTVKRPLVAFVFILCLSMLSTLLVGAQRGDSVMDDIKEGAEDIKETVEDVITDVSEALDPETSGGTVDTTDEKPKDETTDRPDTEKAPSDTESETENEAGVAGTLNEDADEGDGINPWAVVIAIIAVIALLILIFVLIPKRG